MAAATAAQIKTRLADLLKVKEQALADHWDGLCEQSATFSINEVRGRLYRRGFSAADVGAWDRLAEVTLDIGLWRAIMLGGVYSGFDAGVIKAFDRREEMDTILVYVSDLWVKPPEGSAGMVATAGPLADDPDATFNAVSEIVW